MPNHIHLIVYFVSGKDQVGFMRDFKRYTSLRVRQELELHESTYLQAIHYEDHDQQYRV
jgi:REP element-mobilizing transposase RayT